MTTQPSEIQPRDPAGKFGHKHLAEVLPLDLPAAETVTPETELLPWQRRFNDSNETIESLVVRATNDGGFTEVERQDDVEERLREQFSTLDQATFDAGFARIATAAEKVSVLERCTNDPYDTEAYQDLMDEAGIEPVLTEEWQRELGDPLEDWVATHRAVLEHHDNQLFAATYALWEADEAGR